MPLRRTTGVYIDVDRIGPHEQERNYKERIVGANCQTSRYYFVLLIDNDSAATSPDKVTYDYTAFCQHHPYRLVAPSVTGTRSCGGHCRLSSSTTLTLLARVILLAIGPVQASPLRQSPEKVSTSVGI